MKRGLLIFYILLLSAVFLWIMYLKNISLHNWLYGSDLGNYDTILQETLKGNFGLDYNYGNTFGDHASYSFLLFVPFKWLLGSQSLDVLVAITPICYLICGFMVILFLYKSGVNWPVMLLVIPAYIFHLSFLKGNYEENYGFHIDTASGYILTIIALMFALKHNFRFKQGLIFILMLWFLFLKEEMAMLSIIFFGILWVTGKEKRYLKWVLFSIIIFITELASIHYFKTPFNRGNSFFITCFINKINESGLWNIIAAAPMNTFWNFILLYVLFYGLLVYFTRFNPIAFALLATGLVKSAITFVTGDYFFDSWHGFPAMAMFSGAIIIQSTEFLKRNIFKINPVYPILFVFVSILLVSIKTDYRYSIPINGCANANGIYKAHIKEYINEVKIKIPKNRVVALNEYTIPEFSDGYRYSLFPRGTSLIPEGIADYILLNKEIEGVSFLAMHKAKELDANTANEFSLIYENAAFKLYKRMKPSVSPHRDLFIKYFGSQSLR